MKEWFLTSDLVGKNGMPDTPQGVTNKARNEEWKKRKAPGVKGRAFEYHRSSLPLETQQSLSSEVLEGTQKPEQSKGNSFPIDHELLQTSIEAIDLLCEKKRLRMSAEKKAKVIALVYTISLEEKKPDESVIYQILELAS